MYINQRDAQILVNILYFFVKWLYTFRTISSPSLGATFNKLYSAIGTYRYVWLLYGYSNMMHGTYNVKYLNAFNIYFVCCRFRQSCNCKRNLLKSRYRF